MADYNDLDLDHKKEFLTNQTALSIALVALSAATDKSVDYWATKVWERAYESVNGLPAVQIEEVVNQLEEVHRPFDQAGAAIVRDLKS